MKIFIIEHNERNWDSYMGHIIVANNEEEVKYLAKQVSADEGKEIWNKIPIFIVGEYVGEKKEPFILLSDFNAG